MRRLQRRGGYHPEGEADRDQVVEPTTRLRESYARHLVSLLAVLVVPVVVRGRARSRPAVQAAVRARTCVRRFAGLRLAPARTNADETARRSVGACIDGEADRSPALSRG